MMTLAATLTRRWVRLYTAGLSPEVRDARRAEIESDLWENSSDSEETRRQVLGRLLLGMPADLSWRLEQRGAQRDTAKSDKGILRRRGTVLKTVKERWLVGLTVLGVGFTMVYGTWIFVRFVGDGPPGRGGVVMRLLHGTWWMLDGGVGWWIFSAVWMTLFWAVIIGLIVWGVSRLAGERRTGEQSPLDIVRRRYARGEVTREEFEQLRRDLA
jgi:putative membrane protein